MALNPAVVAAAVPYDKVVLDLRQQGIINNVTLNNRLLSNWTMRPIDLTEGAWLRDYKALEELEPAEETITSAGLAVYAANFILPDSAYDTFLLIEMFRKVRVYSKSARALYAACSPAFAATLMLVLTGQYKENTKTVQADKLFFFFQNSFFLFILHRNLHAAARQHDVRDFKVYFFLI